MSASPTIFGLVLTLNEAVYLPDCLQSLALVTDHKIVLDSGSRDGTIVAAVSNGASFLTHAFDGFANQRNLALSFVPDGAWALFLDADERLTPEGAAQIRAALATVDDDTAAFWLPRGNICFGHVLRGGGWWPDYQPRLLRAGRVQYDMDRQVHEVARIDGASRYLTEPLLHFNYVSRREFFYKQAIYTRLRVRQALEHGDVPRRRAYVAAPAREFWRRFVTLHGYRDRLTGLFLAGALAVEEWRACWAIRRGARP